MFLNDIKGKIQMGKDEIQPNLNEASIVERDTLMGKQKYVECFEKLHEANNRINDLLRDL